jgi:hypothetical protein
MPRGKEVIMWGVFELVDSIHVAPVNEDGGIQEPHELHDFCPCHPEAVEFGEDGRLIISHNQVN